MQYISFIQDFYRGVHTLQDIFLLVIAVRLKACCSLFANHYCRIMFSGLVDSAFPTLDPQITYHPKLYRDKENNRILHLYNDSLNKTLNSSNLIRF